jgi:hypothetical protein
VNHTGVPRLRESVPAGVNASDHVIPAQHHFIIRCIAVNIFILQSALQASSGTSSQQMKTSSLILEKTDL